jgi:hypothetical protein
LAFSQNFICLNLATALLYCGGLSIINFHLRKTTHSHPLSAITHWRHLTNDQWEITPNIL